MILNVRNIIQNHSLKNNIALRENKRVCNLQQAQLIGFFLPNPTAQYMTILERVKIELEKQQKKIEVLYCWTGKNLPDYLAPHISNTLSRKDLNFWGVPRKSNKLLQFTQQIFDIYIDFSLVSDYYSRFAASASSSTFTVGLYSEENISYFDMLMKLDPNDSFENHIRHILHYIATINTVNHEV